MKIKSKIITLVLISIFLFSNIANNNGFSDNQRSLTPKTAADLGVVVSPQLVSKTFGSSDHTFAYGLSDMFEAYTGEWWIAIDGGAWVSQGSWTLIWENGMGTYYTNTYYTTASDLSIGTHVVHARFYSLDNADEYIDATLNIPPEAPTSVSTSESLCYDGTAIITWTKSSGATKYQLYEANTFDGTYTEFGPELGDVSSTSVDKSALETHFYKVSAGAEQAWSGLSTSYAQVQWVAPDTPTILSPLTQTVYTRDSISVIRDSVEIYVNGFDWEISIDGGPFEDWTTNITDTVIYDPGDNHTFQFGLRVSNLNFGVWTDYDYSGIVTLSTSSVPLNVQTSELICYNGSVLISWDTVAEATNYTLYEATTFDGIYTENESGITETSINVSEIINGTKYYKIKAINEIGESDFSDYVSVSWSAPDTPTIISPITEVVEYQPSFSVTRDFVGSYVDEFDWEIGIDGDAYINWSTSELSSSTFDTIDGNHTYQFRLRVRNSDFGIWSDYGYSGILTIIEEDIYTNGTWQNLIAGINTIHCDDEFHQIWMLVMVASLDATQIRLTYFESNPTLISDPNNVSLNYFYLIEVEDINKIEYISVTFYFGDANLSSDQLSSMCMYQSNTESWFKPDQIQRKEINSIFMVEIQANTYYALGNDISATEQTSGNIPGYNLPIMFGFTAVVIVFLIHYGRKFKK